MKWLSESWADICARPEVITRAFQRCGMLNAVDGSEDDLIRVPGYNGVYSLDSDEESD